MTDASEAAGPFTLEEAETIETLRFAREIIATHNARVAAMAALRESHPKCAVCGAVASCMGSYESEEAWDYACSECCGHGNEDGVCFPLSEIPARFRGLTARLGELEERPTSPPPATVEGPHALVHEQLLAQLQASAGALRRIEAIVDWWSSSDEESSDTPAFRAMGRVVDELAKLCRERRASAFTEDASARARALIERADRGEARQDVEVVADDLRGPASKTAKRT